MHKAQDDDLVMSLVDLALAQPPEQREAYLQKATGGDQGLFEQAWEYVRWEEKMQGFLLDPLHPMHEVEALEPGEFLNGRFRIVREIAQGGMGIVYEAIDEKLGRQVAIKCAKAGFRKRLTPEVLHASEISHPNVCRTFEIHTATTRHGEIEFLTMEYLDGETLTARLKQGRLKEAQALEIGRQISLGLAEAHRHGVVHGDLKSNNVILTKTRDGQVRAVITDFGLARGPLSSGDSAAQGSGHSGGTPDYMAPELWNGVKASAASDVYGLGVILYELVTGKRPFPADTAPAPWKDSESRHLPAANSKWDAVLARCLDANPERRFHDAGELARALEPSHSWRWWLAAAAALVIAAASGSIVYNRATAPKDSIRLTVLPFESAGDTAALAAKVSQDASAELAKLKGGARARLSMISVADATRRKVESVGQARATLGATHVLRGTITRAGDRVTLHAFLTDTGTQADMGDWTAEYSAGEVRYAPVAMAGMVTSTLRLPPLAIPPVNGQAKQDYLAGLGYTRRNSTIDQALPLLERAVAEDPDSALVWAGLAEAESMKYVLTQKYSQTQASDWLNRATQSLRQAQGRDPDLALVHLVTGFIRANLGFYEQAEAEYRRAIELDPTNSDAYGRLGQVYQRNNQLDLALASFQKAVAVEPGYFRPYEFLGTFYWQRGELMEAAHQYEECVRLAPQEPDTHSALGTAYSNMGRYSDAERELRTAIDLGDLPALNNLAVALMFEGKDPEAISFLLRALGQFSNRYNLQMNLGDAYRRTNQLAAAGQAYHKGLELADMEMARNPRDGAIRSGLAYLSARLGDRKRAESEIAQALRLSPDDANTRLAAAWTFEALGRREDALNALRNLPDKVLAEAARSPNLADLSKDSRFQELKSHVN